MSSFQNIYVNKNLDVKENVTISGNLNVSGTTTSTSSENVIIKDNFMLINGEYSDDTAQEGGIAINYDPIGIKKNITASLSGLLTVAGHGFSLANQDFVLIGGTPSGSYDGVYEVASFTAGDITLTTGVTVAKISSNVFPNGTTGTIVPVNMAVLRASTSGEFQISTEKNATALNNNFKPIVTSGSAGATLSKIELTATDKQINFSSGVNPDAEMTVAVQTQATELTVPDVNSSSASFVMTEGIQGPINGLKTFTEPLTTNATSMVLDADGSATTILTVATGNRSFTIPDVSTGANFVMTAGGQTINGTKTFDANLSTDKSVIIKNTVATTTNMLDIQGSNQSSGDLVLITGSVGKTALHVVDGNVSLAAGTEALPGLNFGDAGTGLYRVAVDEIGLSVGATQRLNISTASTTVKNDLKLEKGLIYPVNANGDNDKILAAGTDVHIQTFALTTLTKSVTLPSVTGNEGLSYKIVLLSNTSGTLTIKPANGETIEGMVDLNHNLTSAHQHSTFTCVGGSWRINI